MKTLGESDDDDDDSALAWINKSRKIQREKEMAEKRVSICAMYLTNVSKRQQF